jgi:hypothetical protein
MFRQSGYSRAISADLTEIERRLRSLEKQLERVGGRTSASAVQAADRVGDAVASALSEIGDRFRGGTRSVGGEAISSATKPRSSETTRCGGSPMKSSTGRWSPWRSPPASDFWSALRRIVID